VLKRVSLAVSTHINGSLVLSLSLSLLDAEVKNPFKNIRGDVVTPQRKAVTTVKKGVPKSN
jgi:hypothetical protein